MQYDNMKYKLIHSLQTSICNVTAIKLLSFVFSTLLFNTVFTGILASSLGQRVSINSLWFFPHITKPLRQCNNNFISFLHLSHRIITPLYHLSDGGMWCHDKGLSLCCLITCGKTILNCDIRWVFILSKSLYCHLYSRIMTGPAS
jgi:hypothetical protein